MSDLLEQVVQEFQRVVDVTWRPPIDLRNASSRALAACTATGAQMHSQPERENLLIALINSKFGLNQERFQHFLDRAAACRHFLNYHDKTALMAYLDQSDDEQFRKWLVSRRLPESLVREFKPFSRDETLSELHTQLEHAVINRSDARNCGQSERRESILRALFGSFVFAVFPEIEMHKHFNSDCSREYVPDFFNHLKKFHPTALHRHCALVFMVLDSPTVQRRSEEELRNALCEQIRSIYSRISNHCYFALLIAPQSTEAEDTQWRLFSDVILFAEKFREVKLETGYFSPKEIAKATCKHIPSINPTDARFDLANEGFFFRDCFVLPKGENDEISTKVVPHNLLLLFEKNERDDTVIPCPACRSFDVAGNSYPVLGVRSWECRNPLCPARTAFDRGNRYSLQSLMKREAIKSHEDQIPDESLRKWKLDVVPRIDQNSIVEMLLRHFSLHGDEVLFINTLNFGPALFGRHIMYERWEPTTSGKAYDKFQRSSFFRRFVVEQTASKGVMGQSFETDVPGAQLFEGDCYHVLAQMEPNSIDGAVTSPPYYNARSYSEWPNIYCYLCDMFNVARQVYRVLRPGATYLFNIFDYFDNENIVVFSQMGKKRMILGAYIINLFRRVGFLLHGNTVWYKGEIEGKRNFNQGNKSPYYQFPFNCWEHVLIFRKPGGGMKLNFPTILAAKPVFKMIRGENILGHSAPFPEAIPELLVERMQPGQIVLDPYAGSMTTARAAHSQGLNSVSIELHREYCELGLRLLRKHHAQDAPLFRAMA